MLRLVTKLIAISLLVGLLPGRALAEPADDDIPSELTEDDLAPPVGDDEITRGGPPFDVPPRPPVPMPAPHEVQPPVPMPAPHEVQSPVPMPAPHEIPPDDDRPPWAGLPDIVKRNWGSVARRLRGWGVSCRTERRGAKREIRCTLSEPALAAAARLVGPPVAAQPAARCGGEDESRLFALLNEARRQQGRRPLACSSAAVEVARAHSQDMCSRRFFSHFTPDGSNPGRRLSRAGISHRAAGENIARGQNAPDMAHAGWMGSAAHRQTMLRPEYTHVGIGLVECDASGPYWTEVFFRK